MFPNVRLAPFLAPFLGVLPPLETTRTTPTTRAFRGSFTRPSASLSTLRRRPYGIYPRKTRFRLVASLCRAGFSPAGSHLKGFRSVDGRLHRFPLSQAYPGAQSLEPILLCTAVGHAFQTDTYKRLLVLDGLNLQPESSHSP
jgi:hypothetical protein